MATQAQSEERRITFRITTATPLPIGEQVFITGNQDALGRWKADGFPLTRVDDNLWRGSAILPADVKIEYKITRGTWASEEVLEDDTIPKNHIVGPGGDEEMEHTIHHWKDHRLGAPKITGNYRIHDDVSSEFLHRNRKVIVWLPPSYENNTKRSYPVLYMHDGQQVFDPQTSTWNQDWEIDEWCTKLIAEKRMEEIIVVAAYCTEDREAEYNPAVGGKDYARFLVEELKPMVDKEYRTLPDREHTSVAGASWGGAISFYLAWTRPDIFSAAACLSSAFKYENSEFCLDLVRESVECPDLRIYLYCGADDDLEKELLPGTREMATLLRAAGFKDEKNLLVLEDPEGAHNEATWARHSDHWLLFFFGR